MYGQACEIQIKKVQIQQNRALTILYNNDFRISTKQLHRDINILLVQDIYNTSIEQFINKQQNNLLPDIFQHYIKPISEIHCHHTRHGNKLFLDCKRSEQGKLMTNYRGTLIWNNLPNTIIAIEKTASFKRQTKIFYINTL